MAAPEGQSGDGASVAAVSMQDRVETRR